VNAFKPRSLNDENGIKRSGDKVRVAGDSTYHLFGFLVEGVLVNDLAYGPLRS